MIQHTAHGRIVLGEFQRRAQPRTQDLASLFRRAGVPCEVTDDLERAHWEKLVWNIPFNGLGVAGTAGYDAVVNGRVPGGLAIGPCLTTEHLLSDARWEKLVCDLMMEAIDSANALGLAISESTAETQISRTRAMGAYKASTLVDFERGQPLELNSLFCEPLRRARMSRVATPRLAALCAVLQQLDDR
jgi:2-dehydropantoate 2-reductase